MTIFAGEDNISSLVDSVTWSGDRDQIARKLSFSYIHTDQDSNVRSPDIPLGSRIMMYDDENVLVFDGVALGIEKDEADVKVKVSCHDMAFYLKSEVYNTYKGTPAQIAAAVCLEFGIKTGLLADNGKTVEVVSTGEKTVYQIIKSAYEEAGMDVHIYMEGLTLCTEEFGSRTVAVLTGDDQIISASYKSSIENMVNQVLVLDGKGKYVKTVENAEDVAAYGIVRKIYKKDGSGKETDEEALKLIKSVENSGSISVTVQDFLCVTGKKVMVMKAGSSIFGLFHIVSDSHTIANGEHMARLGLDFERVQG